MLWVRGEGSSYNARMTAISGNPFLLRDLLSELQQAGVLRQVRGELHADQTITGISADSRMIQAGWLFFAVPGTMADGHRFIPQAIERGAVAVAGSLAELDCPVPFLEVRDSREALALAAVLQFGHPSRELALVGVTGTDGKTTTTNLIYQILRGAGHATGMISTVNAVIGDQELDTGFHVTTPDAPEVQGYLAMMREAGLSHAVLEATSHGLAQHRVTGCEVDIAVVTNITHEHFDFHGNYEGYRKAKAYLFDLAAAAGAKPGGPDKLAILNRDDQSWDFLRDYVRVPSVSYGIDNPADFMADDITILPEGMRFSIRGGGHVTAVETSLAGYYNVSNILAAFAAAVAGLGISPEQAAQGIRDLKGIPGRMERIDLGQPFTAIVDFAHTPNALRVALQAARRMTEGRVIAVFGSAGLRDKLKRRMMAEISGELADVSFFTAEDPRTEPIMGILGEMATGAQHVGAREGEQYFLEPDRREAIRRAVAMAGPDDLVISCGKGHEQSMCFGVREYLWDDRQALRAALGELMHIAGHAMPFLPDPINYPRDEA